MVIINYSEILQRMLDVLKADDTFSEKINEFVISENPNPEDRNMPSVCFVSTVSDSWQNPDTMGRSTDSDKQGVIRFAVQINGFAPTPTDAKKDLLGKTDDVLRILQANPTLLKPDTKDDPKCVRSIIQSTQELPKFKGTVTPIMTITIQYQIGNQITLSIGSISDLSLLGETGSIGRSFKRISDDTGSTKISKGRKEGTKYFEYEFTKLTFETIQELIDNGDVISVTLKNGTITKTYTGLPVYQRDTLRYDGLPIVILQFEVER